MRSGFKSKKNISNFNSSFIDAELAQLKENGHDLELPYLELFQNLPHFRSKLLINCKTPRK